MSKEAYYKLQAMLRERSFPKYFELNILEEKVKHNKKYDILYLSNILNHNMTITSENNIKAGIFQSRNETQKEVLRKILPNIYSLLEENGTALVGYRRNRAINSSSDIFYHNPIFAVHSIPAKIPPDYYNIWETDTDLVLTYTPKNGRIDDYLK